AKPAAERQPLVQLELDARIRSVRGEQLGGGYRRRVALDLPGQLALVTGHFEQSHARPFGSARPHAVAELLECQAEAIEARAQVGDRRRRERLEPRARGTHAPTA